MKNEEQQQPPKEIWIQWHGDAEEGETGAISEQDVTWSRDKIFPRDIRYVLKENPDASAFHG